MILNLNNGFTYEVPKEKRILLFGANRTGKTLISKEIDNYYNNKDNYYSLLFNREILSNNFISTSKDNTFIVTPFANDKIKLENQVKNFESEFELDKLLKDVFDEKTAGAYSYFSDIKEMFENKSIEETIGFEKTFSLKNLFYTEKYEFDNTYDLEFIKKSIKKKTGILRLLDLIKKMNDDNIFEKVSKLDDIIQGFSPEEYTIKEKIIKNKLESCPICYSTISDACKEKILDDLNKIILNEELKNSFMYYCNLDNSFKEIFISLVDNYEKNYSLFVEKMNNSIMHYLVSSVDIKKMKELNDVIEKYRDINKKSEKFYLTQENMNSKIYVSLENEFKKFNNYTNSNFTFEIKRGKLEINNKNREIQTLSLSEQKLLQFIYFRILFLQHIEEKQDKIVITIDDPFDSYDDVYVYNMINIIFELIKVYNNNIEKFVVLSHNMNSLQLLNNEFNKKGFNFSFYWLDIIHNSNEILNINDKFKIMHKIKQNISSFGLPIKLIEKMIDPYSLIVFSSILRENSDFNCFISKDVNKVMKKALNNHLNYYNIISERINHDRKNMDVSSLYSMNKKLYGYPNCISKYKSIRTIFNHIPDEYYNLELIQLKDNQIFKENDLINLFVWKYMCVLKIRRMLERKLYILLGRPQYKTLGDLIKMIDDTKPNVLYDFYLKHSNLFNSFNHSSAEMIPPILIYHASYIYNTLEEIKKIK